MPIRLLFAVFTVNAVVSQLLLRRATNGLSRAPATLSGVPHFIGQALQSPWIYASVGLQILGYALWMLIVAREKLGVATATVGAGFYVLMSLSAWFVYGETLAPLQWVGIILVTCGVVCISRGYA